MRTPQPRIIAVIIAGVVGIVALGNGAGVWFLTRGANGAVKDYAPVIFIICVITPLLSAVIVFFAAILLNRYRDKSKHIPFDLHDLIESCRAQVMPKAAEKGLILHFYAEPAISKMPLGDPDMLRQALVNLLSNAVRFTNTGMVKLHSAVKETHPVQRSGRRDKSITLYFEVKDSGMGIPAEQEHGARDIVEKLGGELMVEGTPGVGCKFSFELTFDTIDVPDDDKAAAGMEDAPDEFEKPSFEGLVLLCEDSLLNQQVVCEHLARVGLTAVVAENGKIGVEKVQACIQKGEKPFDLIFMDIHMPVMDGLEAAAKISALNTGIPIVAMTANMMSNDMEIYRSSGIYDCVGKPFTSQQLWRCLSRYFKPASRKIEAETHRIQVENRLRQKIIINFVQENRNKIDEIKDAIHAGDIKLAHRLAHTLKGGAGQVGKMLLQQAATEVEQRLKDEKNRVTSMQMAALEAELSAAMAELAPLADEFSFTEKRI